MAPRWTFSIVAISLLVVPASQLFAAPARSLPAEAVIEAVLFEGIEMSDQRAVLDRIGVKVGDRLDARTRQRIGQRLNLSADARLFSYSDRGLTFSDRPGSRAGKVVLVISLGC